MICTSMILNFIHFDVLFYIFQIGYTISKNSYKLLNVVYLYKVKIAVLYITLLKVNKIYIHLFSSKLLNYLNVFYIF